MKNVKQAYIAMNTFVSTTANAVQKLRQSMVDAGFATIEDARPIVLAWASDKYACPLVTSESNRNKGQQVLDRKNANFANADKASKRMMEYFVGDADADTKSARSEGEEIEIPEELLVAAAKLAKLAREYEGARKLASKALAAAFSA